MCHEVFHGSAFATGMETLGFKNRNPLPNHYHPQRMCLEIFQCLGWRLEWRP